MFRMTRRILYCNEANGWCGNTNAHKNAQPSTKYDASSIPDKCSGASDCPKLSSGGRCGPKFGGAVCSTKDRSWALYCNEANGWCGNTNAHKNAQPSTTYDASSIPSK